MVKSVSTIEVAPEAGVVVWDGGSGDLVRSGSSSSEGEVAAGPLSISFLELFLASGEKACCVSRGESGENDGKEVRDLSEGDVGEAELEGCEGCEFSFALLPALTVVDFWLLTETTECWETERSSGEAVSTSMSSCLAKHLSRVVC